jgi:hypothetical protein
MFKKRKILLTGLGRKAQIIEKLQEADREANEGGEADSQVSEDQAESSVKANQYVKWFHAET